MSGKVRSAIGACSKQKKIDVGSKERLICVTQDERMMRVWGGYD